MRILNDEEKRAAERIYELARNLAPEDQRLLTIYGEALRDARQLRQPELARS